MSRSPSPPSSPASDRHPPQSSELERQDMLLAELINLCVFPLVDIRSELWNISQIDDDSSDCDDELPNEEIISTVIAQFSNRFSRLKQAIQLLQQTLERECGDEGLSNFDLDYHHIHSEIVGLKKETILFVSELKNRLQIESKEKEDFFSFEFKMSHGSCKIKRKEFRVKAILDLEACGTNLEPPVAISEREELRETLDVDLEVRDFHLDSVEVDGRSLALPVFSAAAFSESVVKFDDSQYIDFCVDVIALFKEVDHKMKTLTIPFSLQGDIQHAYARIFSLKEIFLNYQEAKKFKNLTLKYNELVESHRYFKACINLEKCLEKQKKMSFSQSINSFFSKLSNRISGNKEQKKKHTVSF